MTKPSTHQWPTNGATRAYVDRANDRLTARLDRLVEKNRKLTAAMAAQQVQIDVLVAHLQAL